MPETRGQQAAARLRAGAHELLCEVDPLSPDLVTWQPAADVWSVMDILCHVEEFIPYWTSQALRAIRRPQELWGRDHTDRDRLAAVTNTSARTLRDVTEAVRAAASASAAAVSDLTDAELDVEATSRNPRFGRKPAHFIVDHLVVQHVEKHLGQIRRNIIQYRERGH
jgi:uncharacterized damage-inducible protein DinB